MAYTKMGNYGSDHKISAAHPNFPPPPLSGPKCRKHQYSIQMYCSAFGKLLSNLSQVLVLRLFIEMDNA